MKVLVACEESQAVCTAFREQGHDAFSCDVQDCSGNHPEWHIKGDVLQYLNGNCTFTTVGGYKPILKARGIYWYATRHAPTFQMLVLPAYSG